MEVATYKRDGDGLWVAHVVDHEGEGPRGEGANKLAALVNLAEQLWDARDPAMFECIAEILRVEADKAAKTARENGYSSLIAAQCDGWAGGLLQAARTVRGIV